ncbi:DNA integrity scanning protein DisA [compost metagenome]
MIAPRGYRVLNKIPRLPNVIIHNLVERFHQLPNVLMASIEELDEVDGIGEVRARAIKEGLKRLQEQVFIDRQI